MEILLNEIISYKKAKCNRCYTYGGIYLIYDTLNNKYYVGKSIEYMQRLKSHYNNSLRNSGIYIDKCMHNRLNDFKFYILATYKELKINFFNRYEEIITENAFINTYQSLYPKGYNKTYYGYLQTK